MIYFQGTTDFYMAGPTAVTMGKFDALHLGHRRLIDLVRQKESAGMSSVMFVFNARADQMLLTDEEQRQTARQLGINCLVHCPFVPEISGMTPEQFVRRVLVGRLHAAYVAVGTDFRFGHNRTGDAAYLTANQERFGFQVEVAEKKTFQGREISSTYIREALSAGQMELTAQLMGRPYPVSGQIVHGRHLGTSLGMPTANLVPPREKLLPPDGVYLTKSCVEGRWYDGLTNIGYNPTVGSTFRVIETYLYGCSEDLYGKTMEVELLHYERPEIRFASLEALKEQLAKDMVRGKEYFGG